MNLEYFNGYYKAYRKLKWIEIFLSPFKNCHWGMMCSYIFSLFLICVSILSVGVLSSPNWYLTVILALGIFSLTAIDRKILKKSIKNLREKLNIKTKVISMNLINQYKFYLWKEKLSKTLTGSITKESIEKALDYLEIELLKFSSERYKNLPIYIAIITTVTVAAFWRLVDDLHLTQKWRIIFDAGVIYLTYRLITFRFYIFEDEHKKLLIFKEYLLRLRSEL